MSRFSRTRPRPLLVPRLVVRRGRIRAGRERLVAGRRAELELEPPRRVELVLEVEVRLAPRRLGLDRLEVRRDAGPVLRVEEPDVLLRGADARLEGRDPVEAREIRAVRGPHVGL